MREYSRPSATIVSVDSEPLMVESYEDIAPGANDPTGPGWRAPERESDECSAWDE